MTTRQSNSFASLLTIALGIWMSLASSAVAVPISIDSSASSAPVNDTGPGTIAGFTVSSNENRALVVTIGGEIPSTVSSVSFGSELFTEADTAIYGGNTMSSVWYLLDPTPSTADITVTLSTGDAGWAFGALSMSNVEQLAPITGIFEAGDSSNPSVALTTLSSNSLIVEALGRNETGTTTPDSGQTEFFSSLVLSGGAGIIGSTTQIPLAGLNTQEWILTNSNRTPLVAAAFTSYVAPVPEPSSCLLLGLGAFGLVRHTRRRKEQV